MKAIMVVFDSLNRPYLPCRGNTWVQAPNLGRSADRCVVFDTAYVGSMPCIPARQERPLDDDRTERRITDHLVALMQASSTPPEQYSRLRLRE